MTPGEPARWWRVGLPVQSVKLQAGKPVSHRYGSASVNLSGRAVLSAWIISVAIHALFFGVMVALVFPFAADGIQPDRPAARTEIVGPMDETTFVRSPLLEPERPSELSRQQVRRFRPKQFTPLSELSTLKKPKLSIIGIGAGGGDFADFGLTVGDGSGPEFFGLGSSARGARAIVYVVDRSGSMIDTFAYVQQELKRSISALRRSQKFHVIFFNANRPLENPPKRLVSAILARKEAFFEFLDQVFPRGGTEPQAALRLALALKPDLIYLLSDGVDFQSGLLGKLDEWNEGRRVRIYTIAYLDRTGSELLERIAREHNGEFKFVSEHDLP